MKYTFINKAGNEQTIEIPQEYIDQQRKSLKCDIKEACELYLFDEGYAEDEVVNELNAKADAGKRKKPKRKPDYIKRALIQHIYESINEIAGLYGEDGNEIAGPADNVTVTNIERIVQFVVNDDVYELTLSKKRKPKA